MLLFSASGQRPRLSKGQIKTEGESTTEEPADLLHLAALYDIWRSDSGEEVNFQPPGGFYYHHLSIQIYSVTILTTAATKDFIKIHDRIPVIFSTQERVNKAFDSTLSSQLLFILIEQWLDCPNVPFENCVPMLSPYKEVDYCNPRKILPLTEIYISIGSLGTRFRSTWEISETRRYYAPETIYSHASLERGSAWSLWKK